METFVSLAAPLTLCDSYGKVVSHMLQHGLLVPALNEIMSIRDGVGASGAKLKFSGSLILMHLDAIYELEAIGASSYVLKYRDCRKMHVVSIHSQTHADDVRVRKHIDRVREAAGKEGSAAERILSRVSAATGAFLRNAADEYLVVPEIVSVGQTVAAVLYKADSVLEGSKYAIRVFDLASGSVVCHHFVTPRVEAKLRLFHYDDDYLLQADVTAITLSASEVYICCGLASRCTGVDPYFIYVYARDDWSVFHRINTAGIGPINFLKWGNLDSMLMASSLGMQFEFNEQSREVHAVGSDSHEDGGDGDAENDDDDDNCGSVLHRLGYYIFSRRLRRRRTLTVETSIQSPRTQQFSDNNGVTTAWNCKYDPSFNALYFVDWAWQTVDEEPATDRHFSDDEVSCPSPRSGHATPPAYHSSPPIGYASPILRMSSTAVNFAWSPEVDPGVFTPDLAPSATKMDGGKSHCCDVIQFDTLFDRYVPFVSRRNGVEYIASQLRISERQTFLNTADTTDLRRCVHRSQESIKLQQKLKYATLFIEQWIMTVNKKSDSGVYVVNVMGEATRQQAEGAGDGVTVWALADAYLHRMLSSYLQLGPPFCWTHSFSRSYNVIMFVAHQLASAYGIDYASCVIAELGIGGRRLLERGLRVGLEKRNDALLAWKTRFDENLLSALLEMRRRILFLEFLLCSWERENGLATNWSPGDNDVPSSGDIHISSADMLQDLRLELECLLQVQKTIQVVNTSNWLEYLDVSPFADVSEEADTNEGHSDQSIYLGHPTHIAVPTLNALHLEDIYRHYIEIPVRLLTSARAASCCNVVATPTSRDATQPASPLTIVVQVESGVLSTVLTEECISSTQSSDAMDGNFAFVGGDGMQSILRVDTTEDGDGAQYFSTQTERALSPDAMEEAFEVGSVDVELIGDAEDSVAQTTAFLIFKLTELCKTVPALKIVVFSNMLCPSAANQSAVDAESDSVVDQFPILSHLLRQEANFQLEMPSQFAAPGDEFYVDILKLKGGVGNMVRSGEREFSVEDMGAFMADKICNHQVDYSEYLWEHLSRHGSGSLKSGGRNSDDSIVRAVDSRSFDNGFFYSLLSRMHAQAGPAYSQKVKKCTQSLFLLAS